MADLKLFNQTIQAPNTQKYIADVLGDKRAEFTANITSLVANNKNLQECEPLTLLYAGIKATALDLPLDSNLGFAYVIPYKNQREGKTEAQFQIGYKGMVQLAIRSGQFRTMNVTDVRDGELKRRDLLTGELEFATAENRETLPIVGYVAFFELTNGFRKALYMTAAEMNTHAMKYSQTYASRNDYVRKSSKWTTDFDSMARKTVLKLLLGKYAPLSVQMRSAMAYDQAVVRDGQTPVYVDNERTEDEPTEAQVVDEENGVIEEILNATDEDALTAITEGLSEERRDSERIKAAIAARRAQWK